MKIFVDSNLVLVGRSFQFIQVMKQIQSLEHLF